MLELQWRFRRTVYDLKFINFNHVFLGILIFTVPHWYMNKPAPLLSLTKFDTDFLGFHIIIFTWLLFVQFLLVPINFHDGRIYTQCCVAFASSGINNW